jgi:putative alpha-1,2-mannosidase
VIGAPQIKKATMHLSNGKKFVMNANNLSDKNIYVQSVELNGKKIDNPFLLYSAVSAGGALTFKMGPAPSNWGTNPQIPK